MKPTKKQSKKKPSRTRRAAGMDSPAALDLYDNVVHQLDHLGAVAELLELSDDRLEAPSLRAIGSLLADLHRRLETTLAKSYGAQEKMARK